MDWAPMWALRTVFLYCLIARVAERGIRDPETAAHCPNAALLSITRNIALQPTQTITTETRNYDGQEGLATSKKTDSQ